MNLNLLPCYQIVCSEGRYYLSRWDAVSKKYECLQETDEIPQSVGNCIVFHSENPLQQERKLYGVWWVDERNGRCIIGNMLFSRWMYCEGNFLCAHRGENPFILSAGLLPKRVKRAGGGGRMPHDGRWARMLSHRLASLQLR